MPISKYLVPCSPTCTDDQRDNLAIHLGGVIGAYGVVAAIIPSSIDIDDENTPALLICADGEIDALFRNNGIPFLSLSQLDNYDYD